MIWTVLSVTITHLPSMCFMLVATVLTPSLEISPQLLWHGNLYRCFWWLKLDCILLRTWTLTPSMQISSKKMTVRFSLEFFNYKYCFKTLIFTAITCFYSTKTFALLMFLYLKPVDFIIWYIYSKDLETLYSNLFRVNSNK